MMSDFKNHALPAATGSALASVLPWDRVTNLFWEVLGGLAVWLAVTVLSHVYTVLFKRPSGGPTNIP